mmetsp:Transcript_9908/g.28743  ORF Transcript_9908/g.28743 Transcript_9908/m.28743 type:complete len:553 (+) Transcript_9908:74-1732(+)
MEASPEAPKPSQTHLDVPRGEAFCDHTPIDISDVSEAWARTWSQIREALDTQHRAQEELLRHMLECYSSGQPGSAVPADSVARSIMVSTSTVHFDMHSRSPTMQQPKRQNVARQIAPDRAEELDSLLKSILGADGMRHCMKLEGCLIHMLRWWCALKEPPRNNALARFLHGGKWETVVAAMIALNSIFMAFMVDFSVKSAAETSDKVPAELIAIESTFLAFFATELVLRLIVHRLYFFCNDDMSWNVFDFGIVALSALDVLSPTGSGSSGTNLTFLRGARVFRLVRTIRVVRLFKYAAALRRMLLSLLGSFTSLFWSFALLCFVFYLFSLATVQGVASSLMTEGQAESAEQRQFLLESFGTVFETMLTYYKATFGGESWSSYFNVLVATSRYTAALFLFVVGFTQIALLNIMTGVFVESALKCAQPDHNTLALEQRRAELTETAALRNILKQVDVDGTGTINWEEFHKVAGDPRISAVLEVMGLDIKDVGLLHDMLCRAGGTHEVNLDFLVNALMRMKGPAMGIDLQALIYKHDLVLERMDLLVQRWDELTL